MRSIVVYNSGTGFTETYAKWIAEELGCEAVALKTMKSKLGELSSYDQVIYGGWIMGGMITGYDKIKALHLPKVLVFACGLSRPAEELKAKLAQDNGVAHKDFFYFEGGYAPEKLGFFSKAMLKMIRKSIEKKQDKTEEDLYMLESFRGADRINKAHIKDLTEQAM